MTTGNLQPTISLSTKDAQHSHHSLSLHKHPPNNGTKMHKKMEVVNKEPEDKTMEDVTTTSSSMMPMRSSARLVVKLKKLMQTDKTTPPMEVMMEIDIKEQKETSASYYHPAGQHEDGCNKQ